MLPWEALHLGACNYGEPASAEGPGTDLACHRPGPGGARTARRGLVRALVLTGLSAWPSAQAFVADAHPVASYGAPQAVGTSVAVLELPAPEATTFVLRGTVPVPPYVAPRKDGQVPLTVLDYDRSRVPSQVEIVSRYADAERGADVVEVLARVRRDPAVAPGTPVRYTVLLEPHPGPAAPATAEVQSLLAATDDVPAVVRDFLDDPDHLVLGAIDAFGNLYSFQPLRPGAEGELTRFGRAMSGLRVYGTMEPVGVPNALGLPHLFGVHVYLSVVAGEETVLLDVRLNNGPDGRSKADVRDDPLGRVYFRSIWVANRAGWSLLQQHPDPYWSGEAKALAGTNSGVPLVGFPLVRQIGPFKAHVMPQQGQFHRRLALAPAGSEPAARALLDRAGQAFVRRGVDPVSGRPLFSWWNRTTARYFPQRFLLPQLEHVGLDAVEAALAKESAGLRTTVEKGAATGFYPLVNGQLGWARPYGVSYGGMAGGDEIHVFDGVRTAAAASVDGYRRMELVHRMQNDRQATALYALDGEPSQVETWVQHGPNGAFVPLTFYMRVLPNEPEPFGYAEADPTQAQLVQELGMQPDYESTLLAYAPVDLQHLIRYTRSAKALAWLGNDPLAKDDLRLQAELFRMTYHPYANAPSGTAQATGMKEDLDFVEDDPGVGFTFGRGEGWGMDAVNAAFALADDEWRARVRPWCDVLVDLVTDGQAACSGFVQATVSSKMVGGKYRARQAIEQAIVENGLRGMLESVYRGTAPAREAMLTDVLTASFYSWLTPMAWSSAHEKTWAIGAIGPLDPSKPLFCGGLPADGHSSHVDTYQNASSFGYAFQTTGDPLFLQYGAALLGGGPLLTELEAAGLDNVENRAALLALAQDLAGKL